MYQSWFIQGKGATRGTREKKQFKKRIRAYMYVGRARGEGMVGD